MVSIELLVNSIDRVAAVAVEVEDILEDAMKDQTQWVQFRWPWPN
jgi:hypothetical protein